MSGTLKFIPGAPSEKGASPVEQATEMSAPMCPACGKPIDTRRARHNVVRAGKVVSYCSAECKTRRSSTTEPLSLLDVRPRTLTRAVMSAMPFVVAGGVLLGVGVRVSFYGRTATAALPVKSVPVPAVAVAPPPEPIYGPEPPPPDFFIEGDRWYHPLQGPVRRLPERPSRRFGVDRDHDSPDECGSGHCGCDVGEVKGEPVLAVHDGVVERVVREFTTDRGGRYVRLLHNGGKVVTQYMHLDTIPPELKPGVYVRAGEHIGTVGESGVKNSGPHLHFTVATRVNENTPDHYWDPEPMLVLWPLFPR